MKKSEEANLNEQIQFIESFFKRHPELDDFYSSINSLHFISIQDLSFEKDVELFRELLFILSVIISIISKPHLNNRRDEIIVRSGEAAALSEEDFLKTLSDSSIWKDNGSGSMLPEYVYYHQFEDELKIYENIFIVHLIDEIAFITNHYQALYVSLLTVAGGNNEKLVLDASAQEIALDAVNKLERRINQVKETYFYREVSRAKNKPKVFYPTNILVHDRLYNLCYKFYKKMYIYEDRKDVNNDLYLFYFALILKHMKMSGYEIDTRNKSLLYSDKKIILPKRIIFTNSDLRISMTLNEEERSFLFNYKDKLDEASASHLLVVDSDPTFSDIKLKEINDELFSVEYLSLWHLGEVINKKIKLANETLLSEAKLVETFINAHHQIIEGSEKLYSTYCPSCKSKNLRRINGYFYCNDCMSVYKFMKNKQGKTINKIVIATLHK